MWERWQGAEYAACTQRRQGARHQREQCRGRTARGRTARGRAERRGQPPARARTPPAAPRTRSRPPDAPAHPPHQGPAKAVLNFSAGLQSLLLIGEGREPWLATVVSLTILLSIVLLKVIMGGRFCMWFVDFYAVFLSASSSSFSKLSETPLPRPKTCLAILSMYI